MKTKMPISLAFTALALALAACGPPVLHEEEGSAPAVGQETQALVGPVAGSIPSGMPAKLMIGLIEDNGKTWMVNSGVPWNARYRYFTKGWVNNYGYGSYNGSWGLNYLRECDAGGFLPGVAYYQMHGEPGGGENQFLAKAQNTTTMKTYFGDFKILMQRVKEFGKPALILLEADGYALLERQARENPNTYAAVAATGLPELQGLPNTVAGWGMAFLQLRKAVGANNAILGIHISAWASGKDIAHYNVTDPLAPEVTKVATFLTPLGLAPNQTGATYDVLVGDPLDRDADYYRINHGQDRWWNASDAASVSSKSFNRFAEWMRLWNTATNKRWVLWQIPIGNSNHLNVYNNGSSRQGYKDNRAEYFFNGSVAHLEKFASAGAIALLFGRGAGGQATYLNDTYTDGQLFLKSRAGAFLRAGGLAIPAGAGSGTTAPPTTTAPAFSSSASATPSSVTAGGTVSISATVTDTGGALSGGDVVLEINGPAGRVAQTKFANQSFTAGQTRTFPYSWVTPATAATYTVTVGVSGTGGTPSYHWNTSAGTIAVTSASTGTSSDPARYGFEGSTQGWTRTGGMIASVASTNARSFAGAASLAVNFAGTAADTESAYVGLPATPPGATVTFRVWIPSGSPILSVQPYVLQGSGGGWRWTGAWKSVSSLTQNAWNTISVVVPSTAATPLNQLGVEFSTSGPWTGTAYLDSVSW